MAYTPDPIDTSHVELPAELVELTETLAANTHDLWARGREAEGWTCGDVLDEERKTHPRLIPYDELPESEKEYDRTTAMEALKVIVALGYEICRRSAERGATLSRAQLRRGATL